MANWSYKRKDKGLNKANGTRKVRQADGQNVAIKSYPSVNSGYGQVVNDGRALFANPASIFGLFITRPTIGQPNLKAVVGKWQYSKGVATERTSFDRIGGDPPFGGLSSEVALGGE